MSDFAWTFSNCAINVVDATLTVLLPYIVVKQSKIKWDVWQFLRKLPPPLRAYLARGA